MNTNTFLSSKGGYRNLIAYRTSEAIYDITYFFTSKFLDKHDRTVDQMIQAARSGKQNIAEGSMAAMTSSETEIKLTNVAKASLEELLLDYQDYLRVRRLPLWDAQHPRFASLRAFCRSQDMTTQYPDLLPKLSDEEICNLAVTLIHQTTYMLRRMIEKQQASFLENGGIREQMTRARLDYRKKH